MGTFKEFILLAVIFSFPPSAMSDACSRTNKADDATGNTQVEQISLLNLIVTPEKYEARRVLVYGFVYRDFGNPILYLSQESRINGITPESINIISECDVREDGTTLITYDLPPAVSKQIDQHGHAFIYVQGAFLEGKPYGDRMPRAGSIIYEAMEIKRRGVDFN